ncbi:MAG: hypothetical protein C5S49_08075 [Candidatus Methanogaster sp.]|nr:MAG: hypothetical protein C5S49_08075 [ANME-2 cluster archaeon]
MIVDVSDREAPSLAGSYDTAGGACDVAVAGNYAYVADEDNGLVILHTDVAGADNTPPTLTIASPADGTTVTTPSITVAGTASDAFGIASVTVNGALAINETPDWSAWSAEVALAEGENAIIVVATDNTGLTTTKAINATLINHAPNVSITTPAGDESGNITISYRLKDAESDNCTIMAQYSLDNTTWTNASVGVGGDGMINLTSAPAGVDRTFVWASGTDIPHTNATVYFRIKPYDGGMTGDYATTGAFSVDNSVCGDLNSDGILTPSDAAIALRLAASGAHDPAADVSGDDRVTSLDALMILQAAAGNIEL